MLNIEAAARLGPSSFSFLTRLRQPDLLGILADVAVVPVLPDQPLVGPADQLQQLRGHLRVA